MKHRHPSAHRAQRGVTLVEALVAFVVMALGMLAVAGTQLTLRLNSDVARQRSEAVRLAQNDLDALRSFTTMAQAEGQTAYADIVAVTDSVALDTSNTNTSYGFTREVPDAGALPYREVAATVRWQDRQGTTHPVTLSTIIAGVDPALSGYLSLTALGDPSDLPSRSNPRLPAWVRDLRNGTSVFKAPGIQPIAWVFNNRTGLITARCSVDVMSTTSTLNQVDIQQCIANSSSPLTGRLIAGYIRFSLVSPPDPVVADSPAFALAPVLTLASGAQTYECFDDSYFAAGTRDRLRYYCAVFEGTQATVWGGYLTLGPTALWRDSGAAYRLCRYSVDADGSGTIGNDEHPLDYSQVDRNLLNQNFLVVLSADTCPTGTAQHDPRPSS